MKSVAILSLLSLAAAAAIDRRDDACPGEATSFVTISAAAAVTSAAAASDVCTDVEITSTVTVTSASATAAVAAAAAVTTSAAAAASDVCSDEEITSTVTVTAAPTTSACSVIVTTVPATDAASVSASLVSSAAATVSTSAAVSGTNVQMFTGTMGGLPPPVIFSNGTRPYSVNKDTFVGASDAIGRSCDIQHNACGDAVNSGKISGTVGQCDAQNSECHSFNNLRKRFEFRNAVPPNATVSSGRFRSAPSSGIRFPNVTTTETIPASTTVGSVVMTITSCA